MIGLGEVSPITLVEGKLQAEVGKFLMKKADLVKMQSDASFEVRQQANLLLTDQYRLEADLQTGMNIINQMKTGTYVLSDIAKVGNIAYEIANHSKKVDELKKKATSPVASVTASPISTSMLVGLGAAALGIWVYSRRK